MLFKWFYVFVIERETHNFILTFREYFPMKKNSAYVRGMKCDENQFLDQIFEKKLYILWLTCFSLFLKGFKELS